MQAMRFAAAVCLNYSLANYIQRGGKRQASLLVLCVAKIVI